MNAPETYTSLIPLFAVCVSLVIVPLILLTSRKPNVREFWTIIASVLKFLFVLLLLPKALQGSSAVCNILEISPQISLSLKADQFGVFFALIASGLWIFTSLYSIGYVRSLNEHKQTRYFASFAICLSATIGVAFSANLLTFVIFYEILTIATYPLVIHKETKEALSGGRKYLAYTLTAGVILIAAIAWTYTLTGSLDFKPSGLLSAYNLPEHTIQCLFCLFILGVGVKSAIMPLHSWLPTAMVAPTPVSALLHAVAVVKSGVFGVVRIVGFVFGPKLMLSNNLDLYLSIFAGATIIISSILALSEDNLKRRLAYSTIGHLSYIVLGCSLLTPDGFTGGLLHLANHATMKITLFFCAGAIYVGLHKENVSELDGIGKSMPWTMGAFTIASAGLVGIPPVNGFVSKWYLGLGAVQADKLLVLFVFIISGLLNASYLFPIIHRAYFRKLQDNYKYKEPTLFMVFPIVFIAILSIIFGLFPNALFNFYDLAISISSSVLGVTP